MPVLDRPGGVSLAARRAVASRLGTRSAATLAAALVVVVAVAAGLAFSQVTSGSGPTGRTTYVSVAMEQMRYSEPEIRVPAGNRLVIELHNVDEGMVHDLVLETGERSGDLAPGESTTMDVGVIDRDIVGWCSLSGHRQMGMALEILATGDDESPAETSSSADSGHPDLPGAGAPPARLARHGRRRARRARLVRGHPVAVPLGWACHGWEQGGAAEQPARGTVEFRGTQA